MREFISRITKEILKSALAGKAYETGDEISPDRWVQIFHVAQQHQLLPVIVDACYQLPGLSGSPLLASVRSSVRQQVFMQAQKTAEFLNLYRKLQQAGAKPLLPFASRMNPDGVTEPSAAPS